MADTKLSKSVVVLDCIQRTIIVDEVYFGLVDDDNPSRFTHQLSIPIQDFVDMGSPIKLTVTIEVGDLLNS